MRLATWNVNSVAARLPRLLSWLEATGPDVVCLQETKCADDAFPDAPIRDLGYELALHGDGRWNGVAVLSRVGMTDVRAGFDGQPEFEVLESRAIAVTCGGLRVWSVYVPNGREVDSPHYEYKLGWLEALRAALPAELQRASVVVMGDFNVAPADADVWDPAAFIGSTHVTPAERSAVAALVGLGLTDVFPRALKGSHPFTYWDYRAGMFHKGMGMRIDLVLLDDRLAATVTDAYVDR